VSGEQPSAVGTAPTGLVIGKVDSVNDPNGWGRVQVKFPWLDGYTISNWAPIASLMGGKDYGTWFIPQVGDEAVLGFERGDINCPYVLGFLWNGQATAPSTAPNERLIRSVNKHTIRFLDPTPTAGGNTGGIAIEDATGNQIVLTNSQVTIHSVGTLVLDAATVMISSGGVQRVVSPTPNPI
jgi:uncharacterized protein involved in type VI secretion and phage assembly